ncbi:MAG: transporter substrate-binding domain-containing protein [Oscillospiraceae bacterium]|nr:transporter substrate-binding domain-containing protein [Oscillospiraceae bacterium]
MKKLIALALTLALTLSMVACGGSEPKADEPAVETLKVAISPDFAPMEFVDLSKTGQDQYVGFDVSLAKYIAAEMGKELEICPMSFDACQVAVSTGKVDMSISGFSYTPERAENYNLSDYYYAGDNETEQTVIALKENAAKFTSAESFAGVKVGAQTASLQEALVNDQLVPMGAELVIFSDINTGVLQLKKGDFEAIAVATGNGDAIAANNPEVVVTDFTFEVDEAAENNLILLQKGADELTEQVNAILAKAYDAGLYGEWYAEAEALAGIDTAADVSYDEDGNVAQ